MSLATTPHIKHKPALDNRGKPILAYSVAQFRDGTLSRDVMTVAEIEKRRDVSRAKDGGPWVDWWDEMACKTVAKHHAKMLPMCVEARTALTRDDDDNVLPVACAAHRTDNPKNARALLSSLTLYRPPQQIAHAAKQRRGRPRKSSSDTPDQPADEPDEVSEVVASSLPDGEQLDLERSHSRPMTAGRAPMCPAPTISRGIKDARAGHTGCLNRDIKDNPLRFANGSAVTTRPKARDDAVRPKTFATRSNPGGRARNQNAPSGLSRPDCARQDAQRRGGRVDRA